MASKKTKKPAKKAADKPAQTSLRVTTEPKPVLVDWNIWHKPMMDCIKAFNMGDVMYLVGAHKICYIGSEHEPISADSLYSDIVDICEKLVELHVNDWVYRDSSPMEGVNIYRDDAGTLVAELGFACHEDIPGILLEPSLVIMLYVGRNDLQWSNNEPWFQISFQMASQTF